MPADSSSETISRGETASARGIHVRPPPPIPTIDVTAPARSDSKSVRFNVPSPSPSTATSSEFKDYDSGSDTQGDRAIQRVEDDSGDDMHPPLRVLKEGDDPRFTELFPCVNCKAHDLDCDGVPCSDCDKRVVECTPTRETFEAALDKVTKRMADQIVDLKSRGSTLSAGEVLRVLSEEISGNERFRFSFRVHKGKTQLVSYTRRCYYCHPERLECSKTDDDKRCDACAKENRICRRFAITFTNSDTRLGEVDKRFRELNAELSVLKDNAKNAQRRGDHHASRTPHIRRANSFTEIPANAVSQNHSSSPLSTFPWMVIFDSAMTRAQPEVNVKDLSQYTTRMVEKAAIVSGGFADIWTGTLTIKLESHSLGLQVALKQLRGKATQSKLAERHKREISVWSKLRHPNILPFLGLADVEEKGSCFVSPWMANGDVTAYLKSHKDDKDLDRIRIIRGIVQGIAYLHTQTWPIVHGDIKGGNILISADGNPVLCDFGLAIMLDPEFDGGTTTSAQNGSQRWMAPERLLPQQYGISTSQSRTLAADMFSFAMTAVEILTGEWPFPKSSSFNAGMQILTGERPDIPEPYITGSKYADLVNAIRKCWDAKPENRLKAVEVLEMQEL